jgi:hypothetical protein
LPVGVTYILTDDKGHSWNSASGFNGQVNASENYSDGGDKTFTQTFYITGVGEITGASSKRTVIVTVAPFGGINFGSLVSDSGSVTLKHP